MPDGDDRSLTAALRAVPRRVLLPPLPADAPAARAAGADAALAFSIEHRRREDEAGAGPSEALQPLFTEALADLVRRALHPELGHPAVLARALRAQSPQVDERERLRALEAADLRRVRSVLDAIGHPARTARLAPGPRRDRLQRWHTLSRDRAWPALVAALSATPEPGHAGGDDDPHVAPTAAALRNDPALARLARAAALDADEAVRRHQAVLARHGPPAGSPAAADEGRQAGRRGVDGEARTALAFERIARALDGAGPSCHAVVRSLRPPAGFAGPMRHAKDEWDVVLLHRPHPQGPAQPLLIAESKSSPAAAAADLPVLLAGLRRLADAAGDGECVFRAAEGPVRLAAGALRRWRAQGDALPAGVVYTCVLRGSSPPSLPLLSAPARALLLAHPAAVDFAVACLAGDRPAPARLAPVWNDLARRPGMRPALRQYATAATVRDALLDPDDLGDTLASVLARP